MLSLIQRGFILPTRRNVVAPSVALSIRSGGSCKDWDLYDVGGYTKRVYRQKNMCSKCVSHADSVGSLVQTVPTDYTMLGIALSCLPCKKQRSSPVGASLRSGVCSKRRGVLLKWWVDLSSEGRIRLSGNISACEMSTWSVKWSKE